MKYLSFLIFLFLLTGKVESQLLSSEDSSLDPKVSSEIYDKPSIYRYLLEPLLSLDEAWGDTVTHCSVLGEDLSQVIQIYDGLGSCIFEQVDLFSDEEEIQKNIIFHIQVKSRLFDLLFQWTDLSVQDIFNSYLENNPHKLSSQITLELLGDEQSLFDDLSYFVLSEMFKTSLSKDEHNLQNASPLLLQKKIDTIHLNVVPYADGLLKVTLSFFDSQDVEFYKLGVITNYYIGADEFFVTSIDQYLEEKNEE